MSKVIKSDIFHLLPSHTYLILNRSIIHMVEQYYWNIIGNFSTWKDTPIRRPIYHRYSFIILCEVNQENERSQVLVVRTDDQRPHDFESYIRTSIFPGFDLVLWHKICLRFICREGREGGVSLDHVAACALPISVPSLPYLVSQTYKYVACGRSRFFLILQLYNVFEYA